MGQLVAAIWAIVLRRRGPDILPASSFLVGALLAVWIALNLITLLIHGTVGWRSLANVAAQIVLLFAFVFAVLRFFRLERRYLQTIGAILGVNVFLYAIYVPAAVVGLAVGADLSAAFFLTLQVVILLWSIVIEATILARALSQPLVMGFMFECLFVLPMFSIADYFATPAE